MSCRKRTTYVSTPGLRASPGFAPRTKARSWCSTNTRRAPSPSKGPARRLTQRSRRYEEEADRVAPTPTPLAYTGYLSKTAALSDYPEVLDAVLPCYWIYWEVGKALIERGSPNPLY